MFVIKRNGDVEPMDFEKIHKRINWLVKEPYVLEHVNGTELTQRVIQGLKNNIKSSDIDIYTADLSSSLGTNHLEYLTLAGRIAINNHHKNTLSGFKDKVYMLYRKKDTLGNNCPIISTPFYKYVLKNQTAIDKYIDYSRDYVLDFFGFKTLEKGYLLSINDTIIERPQDLFMRVAIQIHMPREAALYKDKTYLNKIFEVYDMISQQYYTHATPTLFNSGSPKNNLSSCFLMGTEDSLEGIMKTLTDSVQISKWSGGVGIHISNWRAEGALIKGTNGKSSGIVPFLRMFNDGARAFNQGGKRNGSFAIYLEMHHPDLMKFLDLKKAHGEENLRCRDLFLALWVSDLFMKRLESGEKWSTFDPDECPGLNEVYGDEYEKLYLEYEAKGLAKASYDIHKIVDSISESQMEKGIPYILFKDAINRYSMQKNIGVVKSSNLCCEVVLVSDSKENAVCNLASICLSKFVEDSYSEEELIQETKRVLNHEFPKHPKFNYKKLAQVSEQLVENLNNVIDKTWNPIVETARSNFQHRPIGIGLQGLTDVFMKFRVPFESNAAKSLNKKISEVIYFGALTGSTRASKKYYQNVLNMFTQRDINEEKKDKEVKIHLYPKDIVKQFPILKKENITTIFKTPEEVPKTVGAYHTYDKINENGEEAPIKTHFHWELYGLTKDDLSGLCDWETLRAHINVYGVRNSTVVAYMPTASTSQIMGNSSCFEPYATNLYKRKTLAGYYTVINKYLMNDLIKADLWNDSMKQYLLSTEGSIQNIEGMPQHIKDLYKTVWDIKQKVIIDLAADRQPFIDQSQSMNLYTKNYSSDICASIMMYGWKRGLKTGSYYIRVPPATEAQKFTVNVNLEELKISGHILSDSINVNLYEEEEEEEMCLLCSS
jgi:ribonucleoside-diphosphate reductase alpha chain